MKVDRRLEVLGIPEATRHTLDLLNLAVESLTHRIRHRMLVVGHDVVDVPEKPKGSGVFSYSSAREF